MTHGKITDSCTTFLRIELKLQIQVDNSFMWKQAQLRATHYK